MMKTHQNAWLAVNLSMWFPGIGQIYAGEILRGAIIIVLQLFLMGFGFWQCVAANGNTIVGLSLLFCTLIVHAMGLIDNYERMPGSTKDKTSAWKFTFLSQTLPGLGQICQHNWFFGIFFFVSWNASFHLGRGWLAIGTSALIAAASSGHTLLDARENHARWGGRILAFVAIIAVVWSLRIGIPYTINRQFIKTYFIPSESMVPVLEVGDRILVRLKDLSEFDPGEVVVFHAPDKPDDIYIKRLAALPGDTVLIAGGRLWINGKPPENPILQKHRYTWMGVFGVRDWYIVPKGKVFFLGDNSQISIDSRFFGAVSEQAVIGRAYKIVWPPRRNGPIE